MKIKILSFQRQVYVICMLLILVGNSSNVYGKTGDTMAYPIIVGTSIYNFSYSDTKNVNDFTNSYTPHSANDIYYKFVLNNEMKVSISLTGTNLSEKYLSLLGASGNLIATGTAQLKNLNLNINLDEGTYYVVSEGSCQNGDGYISTQISGQVTNVLGDSIQNPIAVGSFDNSFNYSDTENTANYTNKYTARSPNDVFYKFTLTRKMQVTMTHSGSKLDDTYMSLLDASGNLITYNDDYSGDGACPSTYNSFIQRTLEAGTYYVVSEGYNSSGIITTNISGYTAQEYGYPKIPNNYSSESGTVGSPKGKVSVSPTGAAVYTLPIEVPAGVGNMQPSLSVTYTANPETGLQAGGEIYQDYL